ncbi:hypothetical protein J6590_020851 [Homalodisca vitripennis]|nr:hypothetical protein J6590_020851 [Homalodisca vitripennis]
MDHRRDGKGCKKGAIRFSMPKIWPSTLRKLPPTIRRTRGHEEGEVTIRTTNVSSTMRGSIKLHTTFLQLCTQGYSVFIHVLWVSAHCTTGAARRAARPRATTSICLAK